MLRKKRRLGETEVMIANAFMQQGMSLGQVARYFRCNKPSILKSIGKWKDRPKLWRGQVVTPEQAVFGGAG